MCRPPRIPANVEERTAGRSVTVTFVGYVCRLCLLSQRLLSQRGQTILFPIVRQLSGLDLGKPPLSDSFEVVWNSVRLVPTRQLHRQDEPLHFRSWVCDYRFDRVERVVRSYIRIANQETKGGEILALYLNRSSSPMGKSRMIAYPRIHFRGIDSGDLGA